MADAPFQAIRGKVVLIGKAPDGDSVRFDPDDARRLRSLDGFEEGGVSEDGTVQLRLEGIDAPERSYQGEAQPRAEPARDRLLDRLGFEDVAFDAEGTVTRARPETRPATVLSRAFDPTGRPIAYLLTPDDDPPPEGELEDVDAALLRRSVNARLLERSLAYLLLYDSTPPANRATLRAIAARAREGGKGVWAADATASVALADQASIGPEGALVFPKLFRRATDYLRDEFEGSFPEWLRQARSGTGPEDDEVLLDGRRTRLSALVRQQGRRVTVEADLLDLVFVES